MNSCHPLQNFNSHHPHHPCQDFMDQHYQCHLCHNLTHATHEPILPMPPMLFSRLNQRSLSFQQVISLSLKLPHSYESHIQENRQEAATCRRPTETYSRNGELEKGKYRMFRKLLND